MKGYLLFPFFALTYCAHAQNLIADPGFEIQDPDCTPWPGLVHWYNPGTATPDLRCTEGYCDNNLTPDFLTQNLILPPYEGHCMAGLYCCYISGQQTREYFTTQLLEPLVAGETYKLTFRLHRRVKMNLAIDRIGAYFSQDAVSVNYPTVMLVTPQAETSGTALTPDTEWMLITLYYTAQGGEQYMTLGNFRQPEEMIVVNTGTSWKNWNNAYYYFDDVHLETATAVSEPTEGQLQVQVQGATLWLMNREQVRYQMFSVAGRLVFDGALSPGIHSIGIGDLARGIYMLQAKTENQWLTYKIWKE